MLQFEKELQELINIHSLENGSNTPDFVLSKYLVACLDAFNIGMVDRERFFGRVKKPSLSSKPKSTCDQTTKEKTVCCTHVDTVCISGNCPHREPHKETCNCIDAYKACGERDARCVEAKNNVSSSGAESYDMGFRSGYKNAMENIASDMYERLLQPVISHKGSVVVWIEQVLKDFGMELKNYQTGESSGLGVKKTSHAALQEEKPKITDADLLVEIQGCISRAEANYCKRPKLYISLGTLGAREVIAKLKELKIL